MKSPPLSAPAWLYRKPSWLQRLALGLVSILALVATFAVASVVFAALLVIGLAAGGWLWWQYRKLARRARGAARRFGRRIRNRARPSRLGGSHGFQPTHGR